RHTPNETLAARKNSIRDTPHKSAAILNLTDHLPPTTDYQPLATNHWPPTTDHRPLFLLRLIAFTTVIRHVHALQHVIGEKELAIRRHHHDLQLVRQLLRNDFVDQQRILFQDRSFVPHAFGVSNRSHSDALRLCLSQQLAA